MTQVGTTLELLGILVAFSGLIGQQKLNKVEVRLRTTIARVANTTWPRRVLGRVTNVFRSVYQKAVNTLSTATYIALLPIMVVVLVKYGNAMTNFIRHLLSTNWWYCIVPLWIFICALKLLREIGPAIVLLSPASERIKKLEILISIAYLPLVVTIGFCFGFAYTLVWVTIPIIMFTIICTLILVFSFINVLILPYRLADTIVIRFELSSTFTFSGCFATLIGYILKNLI